MRINKQFLSILLMLSVMSVLSSCASYDFSRRVVQQGNLLPEKKLARLQVGMSKNEVAILMGTSLISPMFNNQRWDYAYTWRKGSGSMEKRTVVLYFKGDRLAHIDKQLSGKNKNLL